jgi:hypothetical protein
MCEQRASAVGHPTRLLRTNTRSATRPNPLHPVHTHDVGGTQAPDRTALDDRRYPNEAREQRSGGGKVSLSTNSRL